MHLQNQLPKFKSEAMKQKESCLIHCCSESFTALGAYVNTHVHCINIK